MLYLAYSDDILSVAILYFSFGYPVSDTADDASDFSCFLDDSLPMNGHPLAVQHKYKMMKNKYIIFLPKQ